MRSAVTVLCCAAVLVGLAATLTAGEIHEAIRRGDLAEIERLVAADKSLLGAKDTDGSPPLNLAAQAGNIAIAKYLLEAGADLNGGDNERSNALHLAASGGQNEMIDFLLSKGMDVNSTDANGMTAVLFAAARNTLDTVSHLQSKGGRLDGRMPSGMTLMHLAAYRGNVDFVKYLVSQSLSLNPGFDQWGNSPLAVAVSRGHAEVVTYLLEKGADPNDAPDSGGEPPLMLAATAGKKDIMSLLLAKGANPNMRVGGSSLLSFSIWSNDPEVVRMMIAAGADAKTPNDDNSNALFFCARHDGNVEIAELLVEAGAAVDLKDDEGNTPILVASEGGFTPLVRYLASKGAKLDTPDGYFGATSLHAAAAKGYCDLADFLLGEGAPVNAKDRNGSTPLAYAVKHGNASIAKAIKAKGGKGAGKDEAASTLLSKKLRSGEAVVWYTGHSGWLVQTANNFLVFDYAQGGRASDAPSIMNGCINMAELAGKKVTVFVSHTVHEDHYNRSIFKWAQQMPGITYVFGQAPDTTVAVEMIEPRQTKNIGAIEVTAARSTDAGVGFLVKVDGLTIFHPGDLHNRDENLDGIYAEEIGFLASKAPKVDLAFYPISGCGFGNIDIVKKGVYFANDKLHPTVMFPMHGGSECSRYFDFAKEAAAKGCMIPIGTPMAGGDRFLYKDGRLKEI